MLAYNEKDHGQAPRRPRRKTPSRSQAPRHYGLRAHPRGYRDPPGGAKGQAPVGRSRQEREERRLASNRGNTAVRARGPLIADAGPLYAAYDADDAEHRRSRRLLQAYPGPVLVPVLVITEVAYLLGTRLGAETEVRFLGDLAAGELVPEQVESADWLRIAELVAAYRDLPLGTVDASIIAAAERLGATTIATLDRRHFSIVRPAHVAAFDLVP